MNTFCTIITRTHIPFARAIFESLSRTGAWAALHVLVVDAKEDQWPSNEGLVFYSLDQVAKRGELGAAVREKFDNPGTFDELRWSLKPVFIRYLMERGFQKVIFTDPDTFYFSDHSFLFQKLDDADILLTPHWRGRNPHDRSQNFQLQFVGGLYNAGFLACKNSENSRNAMDWWAKCCLYKCVKDFTTGNYVDQTYLNLMPIYFERVNVLKHQGCNVANWNILECRRERVGDEVLINGVWPIVFIHFTASTIAGIRNGQDPALGPYLTAYEKSLRSFGAKLLEKAQPTSGVQSGDSHVFGKLLSSLRMLIRKPRR